MKLIPITMIDKRLLIKYVNFFPLGNGKILSVTIKFNLNNFFPQILGS